MEARRAPGPSQIVRLQALVEWLRIGRLFNANDISKEFDISVRTTMSDLDWLRKGLGFAIEFNRDRGSYVLAEDSGDLPSVQLSQSEWVALIRARDLLELNGMSPQAEAIDRFVQRVRFHLPGRRGEPADLSPVTFSMGPGGYRQPAPIPWQAELEQAIRDQLATRITYFSQYRQAESERVIHPLHLLFRAGRGYLTAFCRTRQGIQTFRTNRIRALEITDEVFARPLDFDAQAYVEPMFGVFRDPVVSHVRIRFSPKVAPWILEERWHASQQTTTLEDGSVDLEMDVTRLMDLSRWVLSFGAEAEVIEPEPLRNAVRDEIHRVAERLVPRYGA